jgi:Ca2+/H+ antiporter
MNRFKRLWSDLRSSLWFRAEPLWIFVTTALTTIPLVGLIRQTTEEPAHRPGPVIGGLPRRFLSELGFFVTPGRK